MSSLISKIVHDWFTLADGETYDLCRAIWALGVIYFLCMNAISVINGNPFEPEKFAFSFGTIMGIGTAAIWMKGKSEPENKIGN